MLLRAPGRSTLHLLRLKPGALLPRHTHRGAELTYVITGAFEDEIGHFGPGDVEETDTDITHRPVVVSQEDCIGLLATSGRLRFSSVLMRLLAPLISF